MSGAGAFPAWCGATFAGGGQVAVVEVDAGGAGGRGAVVGYATHEETFAKRSNVNLRLSTLTLHPKP